MNKPQFLEALDSALRPLSSAERLDILRDFEEHFNIGFEEGKSEEEIADALGSPQKIAKELLASYHIEKVETTATTGNVLRAVWAVIGLGFFNLIIVLGPFMALLGVIFAGWIVSITFIASPLLVVIGSIIFSGSFELFELFFSITLAGLGLFIAIGMFFVTRTLTSLFIRYLKFNAAFVKGGMKHA